MNEEHFRYHNKIVPIVIATSLFMETLDSTIINSAIPVIAKDLGQQPLSLKIALTSYLLSLAIFIPISGWLSDKFGTKKILIAGVTTFGLGSFFCGHSYSLEQLAFCRSIQGIGGALMTPVCRLILLRTYPKSQLVMVTNYSTIPSLIGPALGPLLGGIVVTYYHWSWIFFVNVPLCIMLLGWVIWGTKDFKNSEIPPLDLKGFILLAMGLVLFTFSLECMSEAYINIKLSSLLLLASVILFFFYWYHSLGVTHPVIDTNLFKIKSFTITNLGSLLSRMCIASVPFIVPLLLQIHHTFSPILSGLLTLPYPIGMVVMKFAVPHILKTYGFKKSMTRNTILLGVSILSMSILVFNQHYIVIALIMFVHGALVSLQFSCLNVLSYADLQDSLMSKATSLVSTIQQLSMSLGVTFAVMLLKAPQLFGSTALGDSSFTGTFIVLSISLFLVSTVFMKLEDNAGDSISGRETQTKTSGS